MKVYYPEHILNDEVFQVILSTCNSALLDSLETPDRFRQRARTIGTNIYDMTSIPSGKISKECIIALREGRQKTFTKEHFHGRQSCGQEILNYVKSRRIQQAEINPLVVKDLVDKYRQVHFTSKEENNNLAALAKRDSTLQDDWEKMYKLAGIELIPYQKGKRYDTYIL